jgi:hypothetical protein
LLDTDSALIWIINAVEITIDRDHDKFAIGKPGFVLDIGEIVNLPTNNCAVSFGDGCGCPTSHNIFITVATGCRKKYVIIIVVARRCRIPDVVIMPVAHRWLEGAIVLPVAHRVRMRAIVTPGAHRGWRCIVMPVVKRFETSAIVSC